MSEKNLNLLTWNCHSLYNKLNEFRDKLYKYKPHVVCLTETWLKNNRIPVFQNYNKYLYIRPENVGGGLCILIRRDLINNSMSLAPFTMG